MTNNKQLQKQLRQKTQEISRVLQSGAKKGGGTPQEISRVNRLIAETAQIRNILHPPVVVPKVQRNEALFDLEKTYSKVMNEKAYGEAGAKDSAHCPNCGDLLSQNNRINNKLVLFCFRCRIAFDPAGKKPLTQLKKRMPSGVAVTEKEMEEFRVEGKIRGVLKV